MIAGMRRRRCQQNLCIFHSNNVKVLLNYAESINRLTEHNLFDNIKSEFISLGMLLYLYYEKGES